MHKLFEIPSTTLFLCALYAYLWLKIPYLLNYKDLYKILILLSKFKMYRNMREQPVEDFQI
jgi:hypothetical protein